MGCGLHYVDDFNVLNVADQDIGVSPMFLFHAFSQVRSAPNTTFYVTTPTFNFYKALKARAFMSDQYLNRKTKRFFTGCFEISSVSKFLLAFQPSLPYGIPFELQEMRLSQCLQIWFTIRRSKAFLLGQWLAQINQKFVVYWHATSVIKTCGFGNFCHSLCKRDLSVKGLHNKLAWIQANPTCLLRVLNALLA